MKLQAIKTAYIAELINSGMSQQEAEELWKKIDLHIDENGLIDCEVYITFGLKFQFDRVGFSYRRPISLRGLETNNGWTRIESEKDLLSEDSKERYEVCFDGKLKPFLLVDAEAINKYWKTSPLSHYKKYEPSADPIF